MLFHIIYMLMTTRSRGSPHLASTVDKWNIVMKYSNDVGACNAYLINGCIKKWFQFSLWSRSLAVLMCTVTSQYTAQEFWQYTVLSASSYIMPSYHCKLLPGLYILLDGSTLFDASLLITSVRRSVTQQIRLWCIFFSCLYSLISFRKVKKTK